MPNDKGFPCDLCGLRDLILKANHKDREDLEAKQDALKAFRRKAKGLDLAPVAKASDRSAESKRLGLQDSKLHKQTREIIQAAHARDPCFMNGHQKSSVNHKDSAGSRQPAEIPHVPAPL